MSNLANFIRTSIFTACLITSGSLTLMSLSLSAKPVNVRNYVLSRVFLSFKSFNPVPKLLAARVFCRHQAGQKTFLHVFGLHAPPNVFSEHVSGFSFSYCAFTSSSTNHKSWSTILAKPTSLSSRMFGVLPPTMNCKDQMAPSSFRATNLTHQPHSYCNAQREINQFLEQHYI